MFFLPWGVCLPVPHGKNFDNIPRPDYLSISYAKNVLSFFFFSFFTCFLSQQVAIKTIKKAKIETEQDLIRIRREIQIMSSVQHPQIIHIYEGEHDTHTHICKDVLFWHMTVSSHASHQSIPLKCFYMYVRNLGPIMCLPSSALISNNVQTYSRKELWALQVVTNQARCLSHPFI